MTGEFWKAIVENDSRYDGKFFYAVKTTGIFCRPSCKSKLPNKEHVRIFVNKQDAISASYRPCKRCRPDGARLPDEEWVQHITQHIEENYAEPLTLAVLADHFYASVYHLQRTFKRLMGFTPLTYLQQLRIDAAKQLLTETDLAMNAIAIQVGIPSAAHFATLFQKKTGLTPTEFRHAYGRAGQTR
ncbi:bifunctional transcriptional activator/DNA repair enzyme AdaA [Paenibacillus sedimenti]|uniref:Methylphosphotriester-DNA--protein-cysteine methyltransferase family protein n=1 Tax=Paenibacillus sedimenti TaxID=2770274 RepID=A0A926KUI4_9BACL|nr:bifunctional transcriptional activator/DNA repair enzyme AdaA [Paenibacillus sedimenti]MBD0383782.1 methylphosphotriester-DNA--protein-cysteine methyltransferase family protein [Paenibacillus sedimenti]